MALLEISDLQVHFRSFKGVNRAVEGLSFAVEEGETLAVVGESGSGKSVTSMSVLGLLPRRTAGLRGSIRFRGRELMELPERQMRAIRGDEISMIFQEPMTALNPVMTIGWQLVETLWLHRDLGRGEARARAREMLEIVGIPEAARRLDEYPHQLSGGMRQRVMIAMALACEPKLLIADEPTTALDVTIQAQILDLMKELKDRAGTAIIFVTHDLGVVAEVADRVVVMYAGRKVEEAPAAELFARPHHPYTIGLLGAMPRLGSSRDEEDAELAEIPGQVPSMLGRHQGCVFANRCFKAQPECREFAPAERSGRDAGHRFACHFPENTKAEIHG